MLIYFEWLVNHKCENVVLIDDLVKMVFVLCITTLYEIVGCAEMIYAHLRLCWLLLRNKQQGT